MPISRSQVILPSGKYANKKLKEAAADTKYVEWLQARANLDLQLHFQHVLAYARETKSE